MGRDLPSEPPRGRVFLCLESARCSWELHRDASRARTRDLPRLPWPFLSEDLGREAQPGEASAGVPLPRQGSRDGAGAPCAWVSPSSRQGAATPPGLQDHPGTPFASGHWGQEPPAQRCETAPCPLCGGFSFPQLPSPPSSPSPRCFTVRGNLLTSQPAPKRGAPGCCPGSCCVGVSSSLFES